MRKRFVPQFGGLSTAVFLGTFLLHYMNASAGPGARQPDPSREELRRYEVQARNVTIIRDKWGIPHIYGKTDADAVFGLLYAECQEDFSRVEKNYLEMLGRQAEAYGESYLYNDIMMRLIYDSTQAIKEYQHSPQWMRKLLDAFADGVNYYLYKHPETKPLVLKRFEPWYALMFTDGSVSATSTGGILPDEIKAFYEKKSTVSRKPISDIEKLVLADRGMLAPEDADGGHWETTAEPMAITEREAGSNGLAIAPSRSASGNAMLYINPHVPFYFRLEVQLVSEEGLNAYGAVTWGQFFIYQGFNAHCGWMHTSSYADVADLYEEKTHQQGRTWVYEYEGRQQPVISKPFTVYYKKDEQEIAFPVTGYYTGHGPVMGSRNGKWLSLKEYNRSMNALQEAWLITKANTLGEYKQAMDLRANTTNNTVYADDKGNIAYWHGNFMPRRDTAYDWSRPVDGTVAATEWKGLHPVDELVHVYNPATGWIQNCNSTPYTLSGTSSPDRSHYPAYMAPDIQNFRALNAIRLLSAADHLTLDALIEKGYDHYLTAFDVLLPALFQAYAQSADTLKNRLREPLDSLRQWDRRTSTSSVATTLAVEWAWPLIRYVTAPIGGLKDEGAGSKGSETGGMLDWKTSVPDSIADRMVGQLDSVVRDLQQRYGDWKVMWGDINRYQRLTGKITETYDDGQPSLPVGLASSAFGALPSYQSKVMPGTKKRYGYSGNSFIAAVQFGKRVQAKTIVTGGESSDPHSPHFGDQAAMYLEGRFKDVFFYKEDVLGNMEKQYHPGEE
jgi:acyl-homoserine lactone acylase PvdQ